MDFRLFPVWTITHKASMNTGLHIFVWIYAFISPGKILKRRMAGSYRCVLSHSLLMSCSLFVLIFFFLFVFYWIVSTAVSLSCLIISSSVSNQYKDHIAFISRISMWISLYIFHVSTYYVNLFSSFLNMH